MQLDEGGEGGVDLAFGAGLQDRELHPLRARRFLHVSIMMRSAVGLFGFTSRAITLAWGTSSDSSSSRLGVSSTVMMLTPVRLPPGRARLATRPTSTGSPTPMKTIGIVEVALFAASAAGAADSSRSRRPCGRRDRRPMRAADHSGPPPSGIRSPRFVPRRSRFRSVPGGTRPQTAHSGRARLLLRKPITGIAFCCARSGPVTAIAPPRVRAVSDQVA